ncbi:hypothetical protein ANME2D_02984 [Candidatus Methanoperedens nitroreducens]|uniref:Uncharacterized protein n=1 Tax=Candidatus Methanoperedens nitratireducens TaxID=1392998 RepID=A0A062V6G5_9EURY|nr:hypothetical protein ANME2D_02984 [Candidatus Methanoperedens nitroreducens]
MRAPRKAVNPLFLLENLHFKTGDIMLNPAQSGASPEVWGRNPSTIRLRVLNMSKIWGISGITDHKENAL